MGVIYNSFSFSIKFYEVCIVQIACHLKEAKFARKRKRLMRKCEIEGIWYIFALFEG
jgi:hypothetical protein